MGGNDGTRDSESGGPPSALGVGTNARGLVSKMKRVVSSDVSLIGVRRLELGHSVSGSSRDNTVIEPPTGSQ